MTDLTHFNTVKEFSLQGCIPSNQGTWLGRAWLPADISPLGIAGPVVITARQDDVIALCDHYLTISDVLADSNAVQTIKQAQGSLICSLTELLENSLFYQREAQLSDQSKPVLLAPNDVQSIKACGVTFAASMLERVIEERALGDPAKAEAIRAMVHQTVGDDIGSIVPGSEQAMALKQQLIDQGMWSQYLEVGIGPDVEVFTKGQPMSAIACGQELGVLATSQWNNPEPEIALLINAQGNCIGAALANDVNLRDYEGRSALLLGKAKDQNGSSPIGPLFRLFDEDFTLEDAMNAEITLTITGEDGFVSQGANIMSQISRTPEDIIKQVCNRSHQYPDGITMMLGTMFAPTDDRHETGMGFTHELGDRVEISTPKLGKLVNWVNHCHQIPSWQYGITELMNFVCQVKVAQADKNNN
ncbi:fumarylacetoacetate hydrolase family protein [Thalassotalea montiporae]